MRARYYHPATGRFISKAPAGDGVNWYAYCDNNPVNKFDKNGKEAIGAVVGTIIGGFLGGISAYYSNDNVFAGVVCGAAAGLIAGLIGNPWLAGAVGSGLGAMFSDLSNGRGFNGGKIAVSAAAGACLGGFCGWALNSLTKSFTSMAISFVGPAVQNGDEVMDGVLCGALGGILDSETSFLLE